MKSNNFAKVPLDVRNLLAELQTSLLGIFGNDLVGIYLHGSLTQGCFNPKSSDVDFVVVLKKPLATKQKNGLFALYKKLKRLPYGNRWKEVFTRYS